MDAAGPRTPRRERTVPSRCRSGPGGLSSDSRCGGEREALCNPTWVILIAWHTLAYITECRLAPHLQTEECGSRPEAGGRATPGRGHEYLSVWSRSRSRTKSSCGCCAGRRGRNGRVHAAGAEEDECRHGGPGQIRGRLDVRVCRGGDVPG